MKKTYLKNIQSLPNYLLCQVCFKTPHNPRLCSKQCQAIYCYKCSILYRSQNINCKQCNHIVQISPLVGIPLYIYSNIDIQCQRCKIYCPLLNFQNHSIKCEQKLGFQNFNFQWNNFLEQIQFQDQRYQQQKTFSLDLSKFTEDQIFQFQSVQVHCICNQQLNLLNLTNHFYECSSVIVFCDQCQEWKGNRIEFSIHKQMCVENQIQLHIKEQNFLSNALNQLDMQLLVNEVEINKLNIIQGQLSQSNTYYEGQQ